MAIPFIFNPGLGMPRDWDLFAFAGVPLAFFAFYMLLRGPLSRDRIVVAGLAITLGLLVLGPRVGTQVIPEKSITLIEDYAELDPQRSLGTWYWLTEYFLDKGDEERADYYRNKRKEAAPYVQRNETVKELFARGENTRAIVILRDVIKENPRFSAAWTSLGAAMYLQGRYDSALAYLRISDALMPFNSTTYQNLAATYLALGKTKRAEEYYAEAIELDSTNFTARGELLRLFAQQGRHSEYRELLQNTVRMKNAPAEFVVALAKYYLGTGSYTEASSLLSRAVEKGLDSSQVRQLQEQYPRLNLID
jgi:tetratricopeptide (TPR) repeat protein